MAVLLQTHAAFADERHALSVPAAPADQALKELSRQTGYPVIFRTSEVTDVRTNAVDGEFTIRHALDVMFEGTRLVGGLSLEEVVTVSSREKQTSHQQESTVSNNSKTKSFLARAAAPITALATALLSFSVAAEPEAGDEQAMQAEADGKRDQEDRKQEEAVFVVGTRLINGDPSARVLVIDVEEIKARGVTTVEEIVRSIPHNFSTINSFNNLDFGNVLDVNLGPFALGTSTANLRGFGSGNTLVLVNGKRIAGASGVEDLFANIRHIPAGAIERVEVHLDGGSAVFGSEAVAGVINIVLRKDHVGVQVAARTEASSTGGDQRRVSAHGGYGWGSGNATLTASFTEGDPVSNVEAGWTSRDNSARYGGDPDYDFISPGSCDTRSGRVGLSRWSTNLILPPGNDGRNAQPEDFREVAREDCLDIVRRDAGGLTEDTSITLNLYQDIGDKLSLSAEYLETLAKTESRLTTFGFQPILVPESNAFNNFGQAVYVEYTADTEAELGLISPSYQTDETEQLRYMAGFEYKFSDKVLLKVDYSKGESQTRADQFMFAPPGRSTPPGLTDRLDALLASDDPNVAVNLFGDGAGQNPTIAEFFNAIAQDHDQSHLQSVEGYVAFDTIEVPAGPVGVVLGSERRREWLATDLDEAVEDRYLPTGLTSPTREFSTVFGEVKVPLVAKSDIPGLRDLTLTAQVHYDEYSTEGAVGTNDDESLNIQQVTFDNVSTRIGLAWALSDNLAVRLSRSEAFRPPVFSELFTTYSSSEFSNYVHDPLAEGIWVPGINTFSSNPDLKPESSVNTTVSVEWSPAAIEGLRVDFAYSEIDYEDRIAASFELSQLLPVEIFANLPGYFRRAEDGTLIERIYKSINISRRVNKVVDVNVLYSFTTDWGTLQPEFMYHRVLSMFDQAAPGSGKFDFVGESVGIARAKVWGRLHWRNGPYVGDLTVNYSPGYINNEFENYVFRELPNEDVDARWTVDLTGTYRMDNGLTVRAGGRNILDADFPYMLSTSGAPWDARRVDLRKRVLFLEVSYDFDFN